MITPGSAAALEALAESIDERLSDELASRQQIAEDALAGIRKALAGAPAAPPVLTERQGVIAGQVLADAIAYREPSGFCADCEAHPAGLCDPHADDLDRCDAYLALAAALGIEVEL